MNKYSKIYVAGHTGMVGSAIVRELKRQGYENIICKPHSELDLTDKAATEAFFTAEKPDYVFVAAAKVGGIKANSTYPVEFGLTNMYIVANVLQAAHNSGVKKLLYLGSACCYPNNAAMPIKEESLLDGNPEVTNEAYALAKNFGVRLCGYFRKEYGDDFIAAVPSNCYGEGDSFDPQNSHVIPALIQKYYLAKLSKTPKIELWGSGKALREFIYVDDLAGACVYLMDSYSDYEHINVGTGTEISILDLARLISEVVGYEGEIVTDPTKPDGKMRSFINSEKLHNLGWQPQYTMKTGVEKLFGWYLEMVRKNDNSQKENI